MRERGFTLLEVLVATVIMAVAVSAMLTSITGAMRNASRLTGYNRAAQLARQKMDELLVSTPPLQDGMFLEGGWDPALTGGVPAGWRARVTLFERPDPPGPGPVLDRVELEIWWMDGDKRKTFLLEGFQRGVAKPQGAGP